MATDIRKIRKLIELVKQTGVGEIEVKSGEESVRISCHAPAAPAAAPLTIAAPVAPTTPGTVNTPTESPASEDVTTGHRVNSPMVGAVYLAATPGEKPYVEIGQRVNEGDTLCLIEAMKMFNQIEADCSGVVSACLVNNEQAVEYDQTLFIIDPDN